MTDDVDGRRGDAAHLAATLDVAFDDLGLLELALVHRSWAFEHGGRPTNERLEFLGDAVLGMSVTDEIYRRLGDADEGRLAKVRAAAVRTGSLADLARGMDLGAYVLLGKGEAASGGADKDSILADTFEAVIAAVHLDQGWPAADALVLRLLADRLDEVTVPGAALDAKTVLQELAAADHGALPRYDVTGVGPDHERTFTAVVSVDGRELGVGTGRNKKDAEQRAARHALADWPDA